MPLTTSIRFWAPSLLVWMSGKNWIMVTFIAVAFSFLLTLKENFDLFDVVNLEKLHVSLIC